MLFPFFGGITSKENVKSISSQKEDKDEIKAEVIEKISAALAMR